MKKQFSDIINSFYNHRSYDVFRDFVHMSAIAIAQPFHQDAALEKRYLEIIKKYNKEDVEKFPKLFGITTLALQEKHRDFMGEMFMESSHGSDRLGQFFTPFQYPE